MTLISANDGVTFINVYSKSTNTLGRDLSNFANTPFTHPQLGYFQSIEAAWYYLFTGKLHEKLRYLHGAKAKIEGRKKIPPEWKEIDIELSDIFKQQILECIQCKLKEHTDILLKLISTDLPLEHFYVYSDVIYNMKEYHWLLDEINRIRSLTKPWYIKKYGDLPTIELKFID
jgi:hypothetical protein